MKNKIDISLCCEYEVRNSSYYKDLLSKRGTVIGEGLLTNVIGQLCELDFDELIQVLEYIEILRFDSSINNWFIRSTKGEL